MIFSVQSDQKVIQVVVKSAVLYNVFRLSDSGLRIYYDILPLVSKIFLSGSSSLQPLLHNVASCYSYQKRVCPKSNDLFARSMLVLISSRLTEQQEQAVAEIKIICQAVVQHLNGEKIWRR